MHKRIDGSVENAFLADPKLSHILNRHLQENVIVKTFFLDLQKKIKDLEAAVAGVKETVDQEKSVASRLTKPN